MLQPPLSRLYHWLFILLLAAACRQHEELTSVHAGTIEINASSGLDSSMIKMISPYKTTLDKEMNEVLASSGYPIEKGEPEGKLGNLAADIVLTEANKKYLPADNIKAQFCVLNNGGLRVPLPKGEITRGKIFELMPFENEMVVLVLSGEKTKMLFDFIAAKNGMPVSGIRMGIKNGAAVNVLVNNEKFDAGKSYKIVTSDYLANGGDKMTFFTDAPKEALNYKIRDAIINYLKEENKKGKIINPSIDSRIYYDK